MRFDLITLFPELYPPHLEQGITRRAFEPGGPVQVRLWPLRDFAEDNYRRVDDRPYGGGPGMVMLAQPLDRAIAAARAERAQAGESATPPVVHFTPTGEPLTQARVQALAQGPGAVLLCGRYEGIDQRLLDRHASLELSLGDYVLSNGDLAALVLLDAVARLQPGVLAEPSHLEDSFSDGLLEGPQYSRPEVWAMPEGPLPVPPVLLSGHHAQVKRWRRERALEATARRRPELLAAARAAGRLSPADEAFLAGLGIPAP